MSNRSNSVGEYDPGMPKGKPLTEEEKAELKRKVDKLMLELNPSMEIED